jgi:hypothetical protein
VVRRQTAVTDKTLQAPQAVSGNDTGPNHGLQVVGSHPWGTAYDRSPPLTAGRWPSHQQDPFLSVPRFTPLAEPRRTRTHSVNISRGEPVTVFPSRPLAEEVRRGKLCRI